MRAEPGTEGDRNLGPTQGSFECPLEIAVARKAQPATLGIPQPQALDCWGEIALGGLTSHASEGSRWPC